MSGTSTPCAMCGCTDYKRTREHILPKSWKRKFPWLNTDMAVHESNGRDGEVRRTTPLELFEHQVGPFCGPCNHRFMRDIDDRVLPTFERLASGVSAPIEASDLDALRSWAWKTSLVRSVVDEAQGMRAPAKWFHDFHEANGAVPEKALQYAARTPLGAAVTANRALDMQTDGERPFRVHEMMVVFDTLALFTFAFEGEAPISEYLYREALGVHLQAFGNYIFRLDEDGIGMPKLLMPPELIDVARSPGAGMHPGDDMLLPPSDYRQHQANAARAPRD